MLFVFGLTTKNTEGTEKRSNNRSLFCSVLSVCSVVNVAMNSPYRSIFSKRGTIA